MLAQELGEPLLVASKDIGDPPFRLWKIGKDTEHLVSQDIWISWKVCNVQQYDLENIYVIEV